MSRTPGRDYPLGCRYQPDEPALPMAAAQLAGVRDAAAAVADQPGAHVFDDFIIVNGRCVGPTARLAARGPRSRVSRRAAV